MYYRMALRGNQSTIWRWKSSPFTSFDSVLRWLHLYRCVPREQICVFLSSSTDQMEEMLNRANQGLFSTAISVDQLWDSSCVNWIEVRRLELELGTGGDHDRSYTPSSPHSEPYIYAWTKLRAMRELGVLES
jgi:hypothetical protein